MDRLIHQTFKIADVLTDVTTAKLSDPTGTYGIKETVSGLKVVDDGTVMDNPATGTYEYTLDATVNVAYTAYLEFVYDGDTFYVEFDLPAVSDDYGMLASYSDLLSRVGHYLFGIWSGFSADQTTDILVCIKDGLKRVYSAHDWSFFRPVKTITTASGTSTYSLPTGYDSIETEMHYAPGESDFYPPVRMRHDNEIRKLQQDNEDTDYDRPRYFSVRSVEFDPTVGSLRQLVLYPTPDDTYVLYARMTLRPTMIDETNQYPIGGEQLSLLITEACLAAAERNYDDAEMVHNKHYMELLPLAVAADMKMTSPTSLGNDAPRGENIDCVSRAIMIGDIIVNGTTM